MVSAVHRRTGGRFSIEIRHGEGYSSWYGNLAACSPGLKRGTAVRRSMVIGSAGAHGSGKAYFDFQFSRYGKPVNFETEEFTPVKTISETMAGEFAGTRAVCLGGLRGQALSEKKAETASGDKW